MVIDQIVVDTETRCGRKKMNEDIQCVRKWRKEWINIKCVRREEMDCKNIIEI
jgi:hypothetical protein